MGNDNLSIISFNSSRKGLLSLSSDDRPSYLQRIFESAEPDICFLPGDDKSAKLNVIRGYGQFMSPHKEGPVLLYEINQVEMRQQQVNLNAIGPLPGIDYDQLVVPEVVVSSLQPYKQVVKNFSIVTWASDYFEKAGVQVETMMESIVTFSQRLALMTKKPFLISGEMRMDYSILQRIVKKLSTDTQQEYLTAWQPVLKEQGYLPSMTKSSLREERHLFTMNVFKCKQNGTSIVKTWQESISQNEVIPDCFIASKHLQLQDATLLDVEEVMGRKIQMPLLKQHRPTKTNMEIPVRPPKHHGG